MVPTNIALAIATQILTVIIAMRAQTLHAVMATIGRDRAPGRPMGMCAMPTAVIRDQAACASHVSSSLQESITLRVPRVTLDITSIITNARRTDAQGDIVASAYLRVFGRRRPLAHRAWRATNLWVRLAYLTNV